jgi:O-antigen/teichoic acid export membrane protein
MVLNSLFFFLQSQFRWSFRPSGFVIATLIYSLLTLGLTVGLALILLDPLRGAVIGQAIGAAAAVAWGCWALRRHLFGTIDGARLRQMLRFAVPLVPAALAVALISYSSRIVLNDLGSLADVGVFALASQIAMIATLAIVGLQAAMTPLVTVHHDEPQTPGELGRVFEAFCAVALLVCLLLGMFASEATAWLDDPAYAQAGPLVLILAPAILLTEMYIFSPGFWVAKRTGLQATVSIAAALGAFVLSYVLVGAWGLIGAAFASFGAGLLFFGSWWVVSSRFYPVPVRWARVAAYVLLAGGAGATTLLMTSAGTWQAVAAKLSILLFAAALIPLTGLVPWREGVLAALSHLQSLLPRRPAR